MTSLGDQLPPAWWRNRGLLERELRAHGGTRAMCRALRVNRSTIQRWIEAHGIEAPDGDSTRLDRRVVPTAPDAPLEDAWLLDAIKKRGDQATVEELADAADVAPRKVRDALERLGRAGYRVAEDGPAVVLERVAPAPRGLIHSGLFAGDVIRFAVVSDTHLGSNEERLDELHAAYDQILELGITTVLHPGDLVCGKGIYPGQIRDVKLHTFDAQVEYAVREFPRRPGITTRIIGGNHDLEGDFGRQGADPVRAVAARRDDFDYLGEYDAWIELPNGAYVHMLHPKGGSSYAVSYKPQKMCESYEAGRKPAILLLGHYHRRGWFETRNIEAVLCGTFEGSSFLAKRVGLGAPAVGFHVIEATLADDGSVVRFAPEWFPFYTGRRIAA